MLRSQPVDDISIVFSRPLLHGPLLCLATMYRALRGAKLLDLILRIRLVHASEHKAQCAAVRTQLRTGQEPPDSSLAWETPLKGLDCPPEADLAVLDGGEVDDGPAGTRA